MAYKLSFLFPPKPLPGCIPVGLRASSCPVSPSNAAHGTVPFWSPFSSMPPFPRSHTSPFTSRLSPAKDILSRSTAPPLRALEPSSAAWSHIYPGTPLLPSDLGVRNSHGCFWAPTSLASPHPVTLRVILLSRKFSVWLWLSGWVLAFSRFHGDIPPHNFQNPQVSSSSYQQIT